MYSQKNYKQNIVINAANVFKLSEAEKEKLANKAGISIYKDPNFKEYLNNLLKNSNKKNKAICDTAMLSDRMFHHIKTDYHPTKTSLLALAISLELKIEEINLLLQKAGYVLSASIPLDMVIKYLLERYLEKHNCLDIINNELFKLDLPRLMTREKL